MAKQASDYQTIKINKETRYKLKLLAARSGESMLALVDRLVAQEEERVAQESK
jgi:hypothetical protein